jgi:RNA polymerase sigma factor (TIGR02999 family)
MDEEKPPSEITVLLHAWQAGDARALDEVVSLAYPRLRRLAESALRGESFRDTLQATGLVHELYVLLRQQRQVLFEDRKQFYAFTAYLMRLILMNQARERRAQKRGSGAARIPLSDQFPWVDAASEQMIDLHRAFEELATLDARKARLLDLIVFLGCSVSEAAEILGISKATAERDLRAARAWVRARLVSSAGVNREPASGETALT